MSTTYTQSKAEVLEMQHTRVSNGNSSNSTKRYCDSSDVRRREWCVRRV